MKRYIRHGIEIALEANLNPATLVVVLCKKPILIWLSMWAPDEEKK